jgi:hypothetical protein
MVCDVVVQGQAHRYLLTVYAVDVPFWHRDGAVRTVEFTAPVATFEKYAAVVRASCGSVPADKADERTERGSLSLSDTARKASGPRL